MVLLVAGCDGCRQSPPEPSDPSAKKPDQPTFTLDGGKAFPSTRPDAGSRGAIDGAVKPGHWTAAAVTLRSNLDDRRGTLRTHVTAIRQNADVLTALPSAPDEDERAIRITASSTRATSLAIERPVVLPKGQRRRLDTRLLVPDLAIGQLGALDFAGSLAIASPRQSVDLPTSKFVAMAAETVFFVVLTERPERFARLQVADWVAPLRDTANFTRGRTRENYRLVIPPTEGVLPLAETVLDWTSTAVLLWDDLPARALTPNQRMAIADWVHFGGTLIVNGPDAVDALLDDPLSRWLPIRGEGNTELDAEATGRWLQSLAVRSDASTPAIQAQLGDGTARVALAGQPAVGATAIGKEDILMQSRVGRGRIVQSRVDLMSDWLTTWKSYDSFFNGGILGRPPRRLSETLDSVVSDVEATSDLKQTFVGWRHSDTPPAINTNLRFFSRDARLPVTDAVADTPQVNAEPLSRWLDPLTASHPVSGLGGWKDDSDVLRSLRSTMQQEIGITIPKSTLVAKSLAIYLALLIPVNYLIFRLVGRLEWAWLAVLPISVLGAIAVARVARLDVGFVRSRTELAMLELHADYPRGHLTRIVALYNSLASSYTVQFDSPDAAVTVVQSSNKDRRELDVFAAQPLTLSLGTATGPTLTGVRVGSNAYETLHTEQFVSTGGSLLIESKPDERPRLFNRTTLDLVDVFVVERTSPSSSRVAIVGGLNAGDHVVVDLRESDQWSVPEDLPLGTTTILKRLLSPAALHVGERRMIGRHESAIAGMTIEPACQQVRVQTIVLSHLNPAPPPPVSVDVNLVGDFRRKQTDPLGNGENEETIADDSDPSSMP